MKVNRKYIKSLPALSEYTKLVEIIHQLQCQVQALIPRKLELTVEVCNDACFINDEDGRPICCMTVGQGMPDYLMESFALELRGLVQDNLPA